MFCACASCQTTRDRSAPLPMRYGSVKHPVQSLCEVTRWGVDRDGSVSEEGTGTDRCFTKLLAQELSLSGKGKRF